MVRLSVLALLAVGIIGLAQAKKEKGQGYAQVKVLDKNGDYKCDENINNDEPQALISKKYKHKKNHAPCGKKLHVKVKKGEEKIKAKIVGFCDEDDCDDDDIILTPKAIAQLGFSHKSAPKVKWEFKN